MYPQINGKSLLECEEKDLEVLIDNNDYRENDFLDYKRTFSFLEYEKGKQRDEKKAEFKNDVCAFANAEGGYLIYGVCDDKGCASEIVGLDIPDDNTDRFEMERRNDLNGIQPKIPLIQFRFVKLSSGKYVVILFVKHDGFSPYIHVVDEKSYKIYKRYGNGKKVIPYTELRHMFNSSLTLEQSIKDYIKERLEHYRELGESFGTKFVDFLMIPETFVDYNYRHNMFVIERTRKIDFGSIFSSVRCNTTSIPCVDGLRYLPYSDDYFRAECYIRNNGIVESCLPLDNKIENIKNKYPEGFLPWAWLWKKFDDICNKYVKVFRSINTGERIFICLSIVGCYNVTTESSDFGMGYTGKIDRDEVICEPVELLKISDSEELELVMKRLYISYLLAIGVKHDETLKKLIEDVYGTNNS